MNPLERTLVDQDWISVVLFLSLLVLTLGKFLYHNRFLNFLVLPFNDKYLLFHSKKGPWTGWFQILLSLFQLLNLSLFVFLSLKAFGALPEAPPRGSFFFILGSLALFLIAKAALQAFTGYVFNAQDMIKNLIFSKLSYLNHSGLILFLANLCLTYILVDSKTLIYITIILFVIINGLGAIKLLKHHQKAMFPYFMYFILYLCALEIAPLVLIGSYLKG